MRRLLCCWLFWLGIAAPAAAGVLTHAALAQRFPAPVQVGQRDSAVPVWPLFKQNGTATELIGYVFESIDLAPVPGFAGVPLNLLIAIDPNGRFIDVAVLSQHEPVFLDGLGEAPLLQFVRQYRGLSLKEGISIDAKARRERPADAAHAYLDGVSKATASVRIINQSVLAAALTVARKKLGFARGGEAGQVARVKPDYFKRMSLREMVDEGLIVHARVLNRDIEQRFAGSDGAGLDAQTRAAPDGVFIDAWLAYVSVPTVGRNLLTEASWKKLQNRLEPGDHALLLMSSGRYSVTGEDFVRGGVPERLVLRQDKLPIDIRDLDLDMRLAAPAGLPADNVTVFRVISQAGLDPGRPLEVSLPVTRKKGIVYPERIVRNIDLAYRLPEQYLIQPASADNSWRGLWRTRAGELLALAAGLLLLAMALARPKRLSAHARRFARFRVAYLLFTIAFIGYFAQGQLSIVNITAVIQALQNGRGLGFMLNDPMTVSLWAFVLVSLVLWGRGTFCGWLCPFGALQELSAMLGRLLRLPQITIRRAMDARLKRVKYGLLAAILVSAWLMPRLTDQLVEIEPFKTAITLNFVRGWPYVAYAVGLLVLSMFSFKFFCRYLCPFGAALALLGRFRVLDWIPRRAECGTPCQTCRYRCGYQAIAPGGAVSYDECFQCMECVVIHESDQQCAPRIIQIKRVRAVAMAGG